MYSDTDYSTTVLGDRPGDEGRGKGSGQELLTLSLDAIGAAIGGCAAGGVWLS